MQKHGYESYQGVAGLSPQHRLHKAGYFYRGSVVKREDMRIKQHVRSFCIESSNLSRPISVNDILDEFDLPSRGHCMVSAQEGRKYVELAGSLIERARKNSVCICGDSASLKALELQIESTGLTVDESSLFSESPKIAKRLEEGCGERAYEFLKKTLKPALFDGIIKHLTNKTLEVSMLYCMLVLFHTSGSVKSGLFITTLERVVVENAIRAFLKQRPSLEDEERVEIRKEMLALAKEHKYGIARNLEVYMKNCKLISDGYLLRTDITKTQGYLFSEIDINHLPAKLNLPMLCPPLAWKPKSIKEDFLHSLEDSWEEGASLRLSEMSGGYLTNPYFDSFIESSYNQIGVITTRSPENFNVDVSLEQFLELRQIIQGLQNQPFRINETFLKFIQRHYRTLTDIGFLESRAYVQADIQITSRELTSFYFEKRKSLPEGVLIPSHADVQLAFQGRIERARREGDILRMAHMYRGITFYFPAFMDFRGRIYRSGQPNFHGSDLARSLLIFANPNQSMTNSQKDIVYTSAAFNYAKFSSREKALCWSKNLDKDIDQEADLLPLFQSAEKARNPYQFLCKMVSSSRNEPGIPISQDASASAYQFLSYFLLDRKLAMKTNLIEHPSGEIQDIYQSLKDGLIPYLKGKLTDLNDFEFVEQYFDRELMKKLFMPLIYGKGLDSMSGDLIDIYKVECSIFHDKNKMRTIAKYCCQYLFKAYPGIKEFMRVIALVNWLCSAMDKPVIYRVPFFRTSQDYRRHEKTRILVFDRLTKSKKQVTLNVPTEVRDKKKSEDASCANFVHQKDAFVALKVIQKALAIGAPIYSVHDSFFTTSEFAHKMPSLYCQSIKELGPPLLIVNQFILDNFSCKKLTELEKGEVRVLPKNLLREVLLELVPDEFPDKDRWKSKVAELTREYDKYAARVSHEGLWREFAEGLVNRDPSTNYSLH